MVSIRHLVGIVTEWPGLRAVGLAFWGVWTAGCTPLELSDRFADRVESYAPAPFSPSDAVYLAPEQALGPPDNRSVALGEGAYLVLRFFRAVPDGSGADLRIHELGADGARARVALSEDGLRFVELTRDIVGAADIEVGLLDMGPVRFVRLRGLDRAGPEPGYDLDAVEALH